jgi:hypothetical protein
MSGNSVTPKTETTAKLAKNAKTGFPYCQLQPANCKLAAQPRLPSDISHLSPHI